MRPKPTREEVEWAQSRYGYLASDVKALSIIKCAADAYLALREQVDSKDKTIRMLAREVGSLELERRQLQADNQALRAQLTDQRLRFGHVTYGLMLCEKLLWGLVPTKNAPSP